MLCVRDVAFDYDSVPVLRGVTVGAAAGEVVCAVGANGAGKSTLLRLIAGLLSPSAGTVELFGRPVASQSRGQLATKLAYLPQHYRQVFPFTVAEIVLMGRYPHQGRGLLALESAAEIACAHSAMQRCDVEQLAARRFDEISGGERRRALLAQAFCQRAELVLLDEPTASLDPAHAMAIFDAVRAETRERGAAAVIVTHDLNLAARFADRMFVLDAGGVVATGQPSAVLLAPETSAAFSCQLHVGTLPNSTTPFVVPR